MTTFQFIIICLAVWRLCSLVANETGPFHIFKYIRKGIQKLDERNKLINSLHLYEGVCCEWCNSIWFAFPVVYLSGIHDLFELFIYSLAVSTVAILIKYSREALEKISKFPKVMKEPKNDKQKSNHKIISNE